jgi:hypothetical protein
MKPGGSTSALIGALASGAASCAIDRVSLLKLEGGTTDAGAAVFSVARDSPSASASANSSSANPTRTRVRANGAAIASGAGISSS